MKTFTQLLNTASAKEITLELSSALNGSDESPFWADKTIPLADAILSVIIPLRDQNLLFNPEGEPQSDLNTKLFLRWCDLVSLKTLAFTLQKSNTAGKLVRTEIDEDAARRYEPLDLEILATYLGKQGVDLENESVDFPIAHYNLHIGIADTVKKIIQG
ncbi:MAG: hypothetical protein B5M52_02535 [Helicobacteraceae bacterium 4484_230]|nr:MAG: hypothetical protein B5M52_02535 [Helicobacteraceae bacterium 4484_230]